MKKAINEEHAPAKQALSHPEQIIDIDIPGEPDEANVKNEFIQEIEPPEEVFNEEQNIPVDLEIQEEEQEILEEPAHPQPQ